MVDETLVNQSEIVDQGKLKAATVALVGSGPLAKHTALAMASLGVGNLRIVSDSNCRENLLDIAMQGGYAAEMRRALGMIVSRTRVDSISSAMNVKGADYFLKGVDVVVDLTNDPVSKIMCAEYAHKSRVPFYTGSSCAGYGKFLRASELDARVLLHEFQGLEQDDLVSMIIGASVCEEVKRELCSQETLQHPFYYNLGYEDRFSFRRARNIPLNPKYPNKSALVVGAGALGNFVGLAMCMLGVGRVHIMDDDFVQARNLNRQMFYYDSVGEMKAPTLAQKMTKLGINATSSLDRFEENYGRTDFDVMFGCVDSFRARAIMSDFAVKHRVPFVSGGTTYFSGHALAYVPGKTNCGECQYGYRELAERNAASEAAGCLAQPDHSVIMSNMLIGGIMAAEALCIFDPSVYGDPTLGQLEYNANTVRRSRTVKTDLFCRCSP